MKSRFTSIDIKAALGELNEKLIGMRVNQIYDVDHKTYLIRFHRSEEKAILLLESGIRIHITEFQWPKNPAPSGFTMKMRKHLSNKRLEKAEQLGSDRIVDLQFGSGEAAYHIILELYDRGNIVLTDFSYCILNILRPRTEGEDTRFAVKEIYPAANRKAEEYSLNEEILKGYLGLAKSGDNLKKILVPKTDFGPALIEHVLIEAGFVGNTRIGKEFNIDQDFYRLLAAMAFAHEIMQSKTLTQGYIIQKRESRPTPMGGREDFLTNVEFHPMLFQQHQDLPHLEFDGFNQAVDDFFSKMESQKHEMKAVQHEREALKKLSNIRQDHDKRLANLHQLQKEDEHKARLIELNQPIVDKAIKVVRSALANQIPWKDIEDLVEEASRREDPVAITIKKLKLSSNHITLQLSNPFANEDSSEDDDSYGECTEQPILVDIDLDLTAYANARKYFDERRNASKKEQKTLESANKAFKSAEKKARQTLKDSATIGAIRKARKILWFEKFYWFISSDNYLVVGGRDRQQNELLVKRYLKPGDLYVHADLHGASSVIIKNPSIGQTVSPRTLQEAGLMAVGYSAAWEAKVMTTAWWVESSQVSKTAPSGEYLTTGSFMIRGRKNFLTPSPLVLGFGLLFRLEDGSVARHLDDRKPKGLEDNDVSVAAIEQEQLFEEQSTSSDSSDEKGDHQKCVEAARNLLVSSRLTTEEPVFPDTVVELGSVHRNRTTLKVQTEEECYTIVGDFPDNVAVTGMNSATRGKAGSRKAEAQKTLVTAKNENDGDHKQPSKQQPSSVSVKRGQKSKIKRIKDKYKDQDDEERQLRMQLLQSAGPAKSKGKNKKNSQDWKKVANSKAKCASTTSSLPSEEKITLQPVQEPILMKENVVTESVSQDKVQVDKPTCLNMDEVELNHEDQETNTANEGNEVNETAETNEGNEGNEADEADEAETSSAVDVIKALTGIPVAEDELLYALPVVAPYCTLMSYKFKVKIIPGQTKRGKAVKTALGIFVADKTASNRERDLIKSLRDQDVGRNLPGRVKLAVPQSLKQKK